MSQRKTRHDDGSDTPIRNRTENMASVDEFIHDIDFPCSKADLLEYASGNGAPDEIMDILQRFPDKQYASTADLARGAGAVGTR